MKLYFKVKVFNRPPKLTEEQYRYFKKMLIQQQNLLINPDINNFKNEFKSEFKFLSYSFIYLMIFVTILELFYDGGHDKTLDFFRVLITIPAIIGGVGSFFLILSLIIEGPSFAKYLREKREYYDLLKKSINSSKDYTDFCKSFYYFYEL